MATAALANCSFSLDKLMANLCGLSWLTCTRACAATCGNLRTKGLEAPAGPYPGMGSIEPPHVRCHAAAECWACVQEVLRLQLDSRRDGLSADVEELAASISGSAREVSYEPGQSIYEVRLSCPAAVSLLVAPRRAGCNI